MAAKKKSRKGVGGRPTKMTPEVVQKLIEGFKDDFTVEEACRYARISKQTYYNECERNKAFLDEMSSAQDYPLTLAKKKLLRSIHEGDARNALAFLERRQRDRYAVKQVQEHHGMIGVGYGELEDSEKGADNPREAVEKAARKD